MSTDSDLATLMQWLSPNFPIGAFAYSHGLEAAVAAGWVSDASSLKGWLESTLAEGTGRTDAIWIRLAHAAPDANALKALDLEARAYAPAQTRLREAERQGQAFVRILNAVWEVDLPDLLLPLALGAASARRGIGADLLIPLYLQSFAGNLVASAQRLLPLGQTDAQAILRELFPLCHDLMVQSRGASLDDVYSNAFLSDIAAMRHEQLEPRIFQS